MFIFPIRGPHPNMECHRIIQIMGQTLIFMGAYSVIDIPTQFMSNVRPSCLDHICTMIQLAIFFLVCYTLTFVGIWQCFKQGRCELKELLLQFGKKYMNTDLVSFSSSVDQKLLSTFHGTNKSWWQNKYFVWHFLSGYQQPPRKKTSSQILVT